MAFKSPLRRALFAAIRHLSQRSLLQSGEFLGVNHNSAQIGPQLRDRIGPLFRRAVALRPHTEFGADHVVRRHRDAVQRITRLDQLPRYGVGMTPHVEAELAQRCPDVGRVLAPKPLELPLDRRRLDHVPLALRVLAARYLQDADPRLPRLPGSDIAVHEALMSESTRRLGYVAHRTKSYRRCLSLEGEMRSLTFAVGLNLATSVSLDANFRKECGGDGHRDCERGPAVVDAIRTAEYECDQDAREQPVHGPDVRVDEDQSTSHLRSFAAAVKVGQP